VAAVPWRWRETQSLSAPQCCALPPPPPPPPPPPLLELRNLRYTLRVDDRVRPLRGANLTVRKHEFIVVVGENGVGKTTLFSLIMGFTDANAGDILWRGERMRKGARRLRIAMVMQRPADFFLGRSVLEELTLGHYTATPDDVRAVLLAVGLGDISLLKKPGELSGGQQKRLAMAGQLLRTRTRDTPPELFLLDEPMAGVDAAGRVDLARLLAGLRRDFALIVISHEPAELLAYADRVVQLAHGRLIEVDPAVIHRARELNARRLASEGRQERC
jgi:energy-coupling factor transport system ATP-binding protein